MSMNAVLRKQSFEAAEKLFVGIPEELEFILSDLWDYNAQKWLDNPEMADTIGAENIVKYGFLTNQVAWINELRKRMPRPSSPKAQGSQTAEAHDGDCSCRDSDGHCAPPGMGCPCKCHDGTEQSDHEGEVVAPKSGTGEATDGALKQEGLP